MYPITISIPNYTEYITTEVANSIQTFLFHGNYKSETNWELHRSLLRILIASKIPRVKVPQDRVLKLILNLHSPH